MPVALYAVVLGAILGLTRLSIVAVIPISALVGTGLDVWLTQQGLGRLIVSGVRTEQCCETTARHACDLGWTVDYVTDATLTWDMQQPGGAPLSAPACPAPRAPRS